MAGELAAAGAPPADALRAYFAREGKPFLWIVDDLPGGLPAAEVSSWLAPQGDLGRTLFTTRSDRYEQVAARIPLPALPVKDALALLCHRRAAI